MFSDQERSESCDYGQRGFDQMILRSSRDHHHNQPNAEPCGEAAASDDAKRRDGGERVPLARRVMSCPDENEGEEDSGGAVVEKALGFDKEAQAASDVRFLTSAMTAIGSVALISAPKTIAD